MPEPRITETDIRTTELELANLRNIEAALGHAINLLRDGENFAERIAHGIAPVLRSYGEALKDNVLPIVRQDVARLEKKVREG